MNYDKPFLTYDEQIQHLTNKYKLKIVNKKFAKMILSNFSYYDLINGYKECFMNDKNVFKHNTHIEDLYVINIFNNDIQNILFKYSKYVENLFKTKFAYYLSEKFGVSKNEYLCLDNYNRKTKSAITNNTINSINKSIENMKDHPTIHYINNHNHIPAWILFKNISFSTISNLYKCLKPKYKKEFNNAFFGCTHREKSIINLELLIIMLTLVRKFRNTIAHNLKFITYRTKRYNLYFNDVYKYFSETLLLKEDNKNIAKNNIYAYILSLLLLLEPIGLRKMLIDELLDKINPFKEKEKVLFTSYLEVANLPLDFVGRLESYKCHLEKNTMQNIRKINWQFHANIFIFRR